MRALLLAAGIGSRLRPLTDTTPKCLVPIAGRPLIDYWFELLFAAGIERALVNTHWLADQVVAHVARSPWSSRVDLVHEAELLGTGGTLLANRRWLGRGAFLLAHADNLSDVDLGLFLAAHARRPPDCVMTMLGFRTDAPRSCGILELDDRDVVQAFHEKVENPPGDLANGALYVCEPEIVEAAARFGRPIVDLSTEVIPQFVGRIFCVETRRFHRDIGTPESLRRAIADYNVGHRLQRSI